MLKRVTVPPNVLWSGIYDRRVSGPNQLIHNRRRPLGAAQMRPDRGQRNLEEHETCPPELPRIRAVEALACKSVPARFDLSRLARHPLLERVRPLAAHEVIPVVQQQEAGSLQIEASPVGRVQRGGEPIAGFNGGNKSFL